MEYKLVTGETAEELEQAVNALCEKGWEPFGGVAVAMCFKQLEVERKGYTDNEVVYQYAQALTYVGG